MGTKYLLPKLIMLLLTQVRPVIMLSGIFSLKAIENSESSENYEKKWLKTGPTGLIFHANLHLVTGIISHKMKNFTIKGLLHN